MGLNLRGAAEEVGVTKSTILRAIRRGRLVAARTDWGGYNIELVDLFKAYPPDRTRRPSAVAKGEEAPPMPSAATLTALTTAQRMQIDGLREALKRAEAMLDGLREDRDKWRELAESQNRMLQVMLTQGNMQPG